MPQGEMIKTMAIKLCMGSMIGRFAGRKQSARCVSVINSILQVYSRWQATEGGCSLCTGLAIASEPAMTHFEVLMVEQVTTSWKVADVKD